MPRYIHRRQGAPFAIVRDTNLPSHIPVSIEGVPTEVAPVGDFVSADSGQNDIPVTEPAAAQ